MWQDSSLAKSVRAMGVVAAISGVLALLVLLECLPDAIRGRRRIERAVWASLLCGFGLDVRCHGAPAAAGTLYVANHVSWTDIAVLGWLLDAGFVAKSDVAGWPVIGAAARRFRCLFIARKRRGSVGPQAQAIAARLDGGDSLILFPEGTTGNGDGVLPFRSSLFAGSSGAGANRVPSRRQRRANHDYRDGRSPRRTRTNEGARGNVHGSCNHTRGPGRFHAVAA